MVRRGRQPVKLALIKHLTIADIKKDLRATLKNNDLPTTTAGKARYGVTTDEEVYAKLAELSNLQIDNLNKTLTANFDERKATREKRQTKVAAAKEKEIEILKAKDSANPFDFDDTLFEEPTKNFDRAKPKQKYDVDVTAICDCEWLQKNGTSTLEEYEEYYNWELFANDEEDLALVIKKKLDGMYPIQDDYRIIKLKSFTFTIRQTPPTKIDKEDLPMNLAFPYKNSFFKWAVNEKSYDNHNGECVIKLLSQHLSRDETNMRTSFNEISKKLYQNEYSKDRGITSRMIKEYCKMFKFSCYGYDSNNKCFVKNVLSKIENTRRGKAVCFYQYLNHFYLITNDALNIAAENNNSNSGKIITSNQEEAKEEKEVSFVCGYDFLEGDDDSCDESDDEDEEGGKKIVPKYDIAKLLQLPANTTVIFSETNLLQLVRDYVALTNDIPKFKFGTYKNVVKVTVPTKEDKLNNSWVISNAKPNGLSWRYIQEVCLKNEIQFKNQSIGTLIMDLKDNFFKIKRETFSNKKREEVKERQECKCADCNDLLKDKFQIDHIIPLAGGGDNTDLNLQALCISCHIEKCKAEKQNLEYKEKEAFISTFNLEVYEVVKTNLFRKVGFTKPLKSNEFITKSLNKGLKGYSIDANRCRKNILLNSKYAFCQYSVLDNIEPYDGILKDGIYYIESKNCCPLRGNGFYCREMVEWCLQQTYILPSNILYQYLPSTAITPSSFEPFVTFLESQFEEERLKKLASNSLVGLFGRREGEMFKSQLCANQEEVASSYWELNRPYVVNIAEELKCVVGKYSINRLDSYFPLHLQVLDIEAIELDKMRLIVKKSGGICCGLKTDCVSYLSTEAVDIADYFWDENQTIKKYKAEPFSVVFRKENLTNKNTFELQSKVYNNIQEKDNFNELANDIIKSGKSVLNNSPAGSGKSFLTNLIIGKLKDTEIIRLAPTNIAALLIGGVTLDKFCNSLSKRSFKYIKYVFVDEISMMRERFYEYLLSIKLANPHLIFIISGDFFQLPPVNDKINKQGDNTDIYRFSDCLFQLTDGNILELTKCRRSDDKLFNLCEDLKNKREIVIKPFIKTGFNYKNLCFTNKKRIELNAKCCSKYLKEYPNKQRFKVEAISYDKNSQVFVLVEGMPLISRVNNKAFDILNNETFVCVKIKKNVIVVANEKKQNIEIEKSRFSRLFYVNFCSTVHKSQGQTYDKPYTIYEWEKMNYTLQYVAMSRATDLKFITIEGEGDWRFI